MPPTSPSYPRTVIDQLGRAVQLPHPPRRLVSLVPSQTELLVDLGLSAQLVGATKFCTHPAAVRRTASLVGGTKNFDFTQIDALRPDLILGNKEENYLAGIEQLARSYPVWVSEVADLPGALDMIRRVGDLTGTLPAATALAAEVAGAFGQLSRPASLTPAAYFIWRKPYMVAAGSTFIDDMLRRAGFANVFAHLGRYPEITPAQLAAAAPAHILLSSEPYPFQAKHVVEFQAICPAAAVQVVDGELFSWYGSRLRHSASYFRTLAPLA